MTSSKLSKHTTLYRPLIALLILTIAVLLINYFFGQANGIEPISTRSNRIAQAAEPAPSCRYGVSANLDQIPQALDLSVGWVQHFDGIFPSPAPNVEVTPLIRVRQHKDGFTYLDGYDVIPTLPAIANLVDDFPGHLWLIGNEPDRGPQPGDSVGGQDDTYPNVYAKAYHDIYHVIKGRDPTAQVANAGLVEVTPGRLQYLDLVYNAYLSLYGVPIPVDVWNMHIYILAEAFLNGDPNGIASVALGTDKKLAKREAGWDYERASRCPLDEIYCFAEHDDMTVFAEQVLAMRKWMYDHGQREKPLILTEFSLILPYLPPGWNDCFEDEYGECFHPARVRGFLNNSFDYLESASHPLYGDPHDEDRLVQQWNWFKVSVQGTGDISNLYVWNSDQITLVGEAYKQQTTSAPRYMNLVPGRTNLPVAYTDEATGLAQAQVSVTVMNNGSIPVDQAFAVSFYPADDNETPFATVEVPAPEPGISGLAGCARRELVVSATWNDIPPGLQHYRVELDSGDAIVENDPNDEGELDNVTTGSVLVDPEQSFLPVVRKK